MGDGLARRLSDPLRSTGTRQGIGDKTGECRIGRRLLLDHPLVVRCARSQEIRRDPVGHDCIAQEPLVEPPYELALGCDFRALRRTMSPPMPATPMTA